jgi:DNA-binding PadR family transcriptional regulator
MILQALNRKPMHGYALAQHIKDISDDLLQIEEGSLYPALQRMLKIGWLESEMGLSAKQETEDSVKPEQYQLVDTSQYIYRVSVTDMDR